VFGLPGINDNCFSLIFKDSYRIIEEELEEREEGDDPSFEEKTNESTVSKLTSLGRSLSSIEIAPLWAEMVGVAWPRDPLQRVEIEEGLRFKLEWKMIWSDDNQFTRVNCVACNPQDRVHLYLSQIAPKNFLNSNWLIIFSPLRCCSPLRIRT
jgi:hypothetical protein